MIRNALRTLGLVRLRLEEVSDIVRHLDEMMNVHCGLTLRRGSLFEQLFLTLCKFAVLLLPL